MVPEDNVPDANGQAPPPPPEQSQQDPQKGGGVANNPGGGCVANNPRGGVWLTTLDTAPNQYDNDDSSSRSTPAPEDSGRNATRGTSSGPTSIGVVVDPPPSSARAMEPDANSEESSGEDEPCMFWTWLVGMY